MAATRREFLARIGTGTLIAALGYETALDLGLTQARADGDDARLNFGSREPLVRLLQETSINDLQATLVNKLKSGTSLEELVAAAALANARTFGGEDYVGFHTLMALSPAYAMSQRLPKEKRALPILKVLYRNTNRIAEFGGPSKEVLQPVTQSEEGQPADAISLRKAVESRDMATAERLFAQICRGTPDDAYNMLLPTVQDATEVHRVVLAYRAWDMLNLVGMEAADTMLRQSLHYCVKNEEHTYDRPCAGMREVLPKLLDQYHLVARKRATRTADDQWTGQFADQLFTLAPEQAADAVAAALADGIPMESVNEAISLAANQLVLRDAGRTEKEVRPGKPLGSVHGDSIGVHACDSANAWRNIARISNPRNAIASTILAGYQVALDRINRGGDFANWKARPNPDEVAAIETTDAMALLGALREAVTGNDQQRACAVVEKYHTCGHPAEPVFATLLDYAVSEDGALHAEKYFQTTADEFAHTSPAFRWRQLVGLARVTASTYGQPAPGQEEARKLLGLS